MNSVEEYRKQGVSRYDGLYDGLILQGYADAAIAELEADGKMLVADADRAWAGVRELQEKVAEMEAHAEHDEDNLEGLQHALVRANQRSTQAEAELAKIEDGYEILATKLSEANAELVRLETQPRSD